MADLIPKKDDSVLPTEIIERRIYFVRGEKVMLDSDLAELYEVETFNLNKAVKWNLGRFPADFMFQLTREEWDRLKFQTGIAKPGREGRRTPPYAFTEQGVAKLASVLRSERAVQVNIAIVRAFLRLRTLLASHADLARKLEQLEDRYDQQFRDVFEAIRNLMRPPEEEPRPIGFKPDA